MDILDGSALNVFHFSANFPPTFSPTQPSLLYAVFDQELNVTLNVTDPEGKAIRLRVDTVINQTEWQLSKWNDNQRPIFMASVYIGVCIYNAATFRDTS